MERQWHLKCGHKPHAGPYNPTTNPSLLFILNSPPLLENGRGCFCGCSMLLYLQFEMHRDVIFPQADSDITSKPKVPPALGEETSGSDADKFSAGWRLAPYCLPSHSCSLLNGFLSFHDFFAPSECLCLPWQFYLLAFGSIECLKVRWEFQIFMISKFHCANKIINPQCVGRVVTFQNRAAFVPEVPIENTAWTLHSLGSFIFWVNCGPEYFILASTEFTMPVLKQSSW